MGVNHLGVVVAFVNYHKCPNVIKILPQLVQHVGQVIMTGIASEVTSPLEVCFRPCSEVAIEREVLPGIRGVTEDQVALLRERDRPEVSVDDLDLIAIDADVLAILQQVRPLLLVGKFSRLVQ